MRRLAPLAVLALTACGWDHLPDGSFVEREGPLWNPDRVLAAEDGLYIPLERARRLVRIDGSGVATEVDLGGALLDQVTLAPDGRTVVATVREFRCVADDPRELRGVDTLDDCPSALREVDGFVVAIEEGEVRSRVPVSAHYNALTFADDGRWAIAWLDVDAGVSFEDAGVVDLTSVLVLDLEEGVSTPVSVGFGAENVLFTPEADRAVVLSRSSVALVDLRGESPERGTTFPLTLDADQTVQPVGVDLTPDGAYALITARHQDDLYVLRLERPSVNLVNLSGQPSDMAVFEGIDAQDDIADERTVVVHAGTARVDLVDHDAFDVDSLVLDEPMDHIAPVGRTAVLWGSAGQQDVYSLDLDDETLIEYRLENPPRSLQVAPTGEFAVALTGPTGGLDFFDTRHLLEVLDLSDDRGRSRPHLLEAPGRDLAFNVTDTRLDVLVLQSGTDYLFQLDLYTQQAQEVDLPAPPVALGARPGGGFWVSHDASLGLITLYDPASGEQVEVAGFAAYGLLEDLPLAEDPNADEES
jgi:hypothetical protein